MQQSRSGDSSKRSLLSFHGNGSEYFSVFIVNMLFTLVTFGIYYPWAKVNILRYTYGETEMHGSRFTFHGTGKELFKGLIKAIAVFVGIAGIYYSLLSTEEPALLVAATLFLYSCLGILYPIAIHGSVKYRTSRSSWRGIHFSYEGDRNILLKQFIKDGLLTIITLGIYGSWLVTNLRRYVVNNIRFGKMKLGFTGNGSDFFALNLVGIILSYLTLGIYLFWYSRNLYNFWVNNLYLEDETGARHRFRSTATGGGFFRLYVGNFFIVIFTLGLGTPWAVVRTLKFSMNNAELQSEVNFDNLAQTDQEYTNATGEELADAFDIDFI